MKFKAFYLYQDATNQSGDMSRERAAYLLRAARSRRFGNIGRTLYGGYQIKDAPWLFLPANENENTERRRNSDTGTLVHGDKPFEIGYHSSHWSESEFTPYAGAVTLEN